MAVMRIVCLANSRKLSGRCVAGKVVGSGAWLRPVSDRFHEEVSWHERHYQDGGDPQVLDVIDVPLRHPKPNQHQAENWVLDSRYYWVRQGRVGWCDVASLVDQTPTLWPIGQSSYNGENDRIALSVAQQQKGSLYFISVDSLVVKVFAPGEYFGEPKRRVQGRFTYNGTRYKLWITDPTIEKAYLAKSNGEYSMSKCHLTVSLGEPHNDGFVYKLIAAVITTDVASG